MSNQENLQKPRKKYEKPAVIFLGLLEAQAAACQPYPIPSPAENCEKIGKADFTCTTPKS